LAAAADRESESEMTDARVAKPFTLLLPAGLLPVYALDIVFVMQPRALVYSGQKVRSEAACVRVCREQIAGQGSIFAHKLLRDRCARLLFLASQLTCALCYLSLNVRALKNRSFLFF
jgi:hypothetical protein